MQEHKRQCLSSPAKGYLNESVKQPQKEEGNQRLNHRSILTARLDIPTPLPSRRPDKLSAKAAELAEEARQGIPAPLEGGFRRGIAVPCLVSNNLIG